jgi:hypothetical protein
MSKSSYFTKKDACNPLLEASPEACHGTYWKSNSYLLSSGSRYITKMKRGKIAVIAIIVYVLFLFIFLLVVSHSELQKVLFTFTGSPQTTQCLCLTMATFVSFCECDISVAL